MTQDEIILIADASGLSFYGMGKDRDKFLHYLEVFADLVAAAEREACAKMADEHMQESEGKSFGVGNAIRARGQA
jgi:hypothetical protein